MKIILVVLAVIALAVGYIAMRGTALDKESKAYADAAIPAIVTNWNEKELLNRESREFSNATPQQQLDQMFQWFATLGHLRTCSPAAGQCLMSYNPQNGKQVTAQYLAKATFDKGEAAIQLNLIQHDGEWQIAGFRVNSPALMPRK